MALNFSIQVSKDHAQVTAKWDISLDISDTELISSFTLTVEGKPLDTQCSSGNKACHSAAITILSKPDEDCPVSFVISTNDPGADPATGEDILRGDRTFDDVTFP